MRKTNIGPGRFHRVTNCKSLIVGSPLQRDHNVAEGHTLRFGFAKSYAFCELVFANFIRIFAKKRAYGLSPQN
jgi:hypothetical protein